jgi:UrcA family protein
MTNFTARIAGFATLALAALPIAALSSAAHATEYRISVADLNLATAQGAAKFDARLHRATNVICGSNRAIAERMECEAAVRAEAMDKLTIQQRRAFAGATTTVASR